MGDATGKTVFMNTRMASIFGPLLGFRFGELRHTLTGQKIDGSQ